MQFSKKALIFGVDSFTGGYLEQSFQKQGIKVLVQHFLTKILLHIAISLII